MRYASGLFLVVTFFAGCAQSPGKDVGLATSEGASPRPSAIVTASALPPASAAVPASASASATASASASNAPVDLSRAPALRDDSGAVLDQTKDKPTTSSPAFQARMELLWKAIVKNDPSIAEPVFFPVVAYEKVKDIEKPASDHKHRLMKAFSRNIKEYHDDLGPEPEAVKLLGVDIDEGRVKWMDPGKEGNKLGYWRVTRSKIRFADPSGKEKTLELTSLISWRGEWFVVHLHGFK